MIQGPSLQYICQMGLGVLFLKEGSFLESSSNVFLHYGSDTRLKGLFPLLDLKEKNITSSCSYINGLLSLSSSISS